MKNIFFTLASFLLISFGYSQEKDVFYFPNINNDEKLVNHFAFSLVYSEVHEQAKWVAYKLTKGETNKKYKRTDRFIIDPKIATGSATSPDYKGSGFDRGHLAPAGDMAWSQTAMEESFYYSNMSPQKASFNRGIWKKLESLVRGWAVLYDSIIVVTGPILKGNLNSIGPSSVSVPRSYFKVILKLGEEKEAIGFVLKNEAGSSSLSASTKTIDEIEKLTGLDFFHSLSDDLENSLESKICQSCWNWTASSIKNNSSTPSETSVQCKGKTKAGNRCKNSTLNSIGYCHLHQPSKVNFSEPETTKRAFSVQCLGTTQKGLICKRKTRSPNGKCYQHGGD